MEQTRTISSPVSVEDFQEGRTPNSKGRRARRDDAGGWTLFWRMIQGGVGKYLFVELVNGNRYWTNLGDAPGRVVRTSAYEVQLANCIDEAGHHLGTHIFPKTAIARATLTTQVGTVARSSVHDCGAGG